MKLADTDILRLLPGHIADDPQFAATGGAASPVLDSFNQALAIYDRDSTGAGVTSLTG